MDKLNELTLTPEPTTNRLDQRQLLDYQSHREDCLTWLLTFGKKPSQAKGYALETIKGSSYRIDRFYRWVWDTEERYTTGVTHAHADEWMRELARQDGSNTHKANAQKAVKRLFEWRHHEHGPKEWTPQTAMSVTEIPSMVGRRNV